MHQKNNDILFPLSLFLIVLITRVPFTSKLLYHWDSVQFALALEKYDITIHQPHPPGYFLYVMLGRLLNLFIEDANMVFVSISFIFSGLTVIAIYYLAKEMYDKQIAILAALIALTSPNLWFHGEVALTYIVEAFFSAAVALLCWRVLKGEHKYIWLSVLALGIAGGIRQNTIVFLLPLWLFSVKSVPIKKIMLSLVLLGLVCFLWFVPMVWMTGGWHAYREAFRELWMFNTGHISVFEKGWTSFKIFSSALFDFTIYGIGAGILILVLAFYSLLRHGRFKSLERNEVFFFSFWMLPSILFYLLIFIHPANPGYVLIFLPAFFILVAASIKYVSAELMSLLKRDLFKLIAFGIISFNTAIFFLSQYPVSLEEIRNHDRSLAIMLESIKTFDPSSTAIFFGQPYIFFGYRQIMYYLPEYRVYQIDIRSAPTREIRKIIWSINRETFLTNEIILPKNIATLVIPLFSNERYKASLINKLTVKTLPPSRITIASGPIILIKEFFPELRVRLQNEI